MKRTLPPSGLALLMSVLVVAGCRTRTTKPSTPPIAQVTRPVSPDAMTRQQVTGIIATYRKIVSPNGVEELRPLQINGSQQWVSIRGRDRRNPILLYLHGGPGSPTMPEAYTFQAPWEDYFTVVQWDQRGAGKTYAANDPRALASTMTPEQMTRDAESVVSYLRQTYGKRKIFLLGHSWGTVLGLMLVRRHPDWFYAYIGVGQIVNMRKSEADGYAFALAEARAHHNVQAEHDLLSLAPYPGPPDSLTLDRIGRQRKWLNYYGGLTYGRTSFDYDDEVRMLSPDYTDRDLASIDSGGAYSLAHLLPAVASLDFDSVTVFKCPIFVFNGRHDYAVSHRLSAEWFKRIKAPLKKLIWFDNSAHMMMQEEPGRFVYHLIVDVRPVAVKAGDGVPAWAPAGAAPTRSAIAG